MRPNPFRAQSASGAGGAGAAPAAALATALLGWPPLPPVVPVAAEVGGDGGDGEGFGRPNPFRSGKQPAIPVSPVAGGRRRAAAQGRVSHEIDPAGLTVEAAPLSSGAFGTVYPGRYHGVAVAVKAAAAQPSSRGASGDRGAAATPAAVLAAEIDLLRMLCHPNVVRFIGVADR